MADTQVTSRLSSALRDGMERKFEDLLAKAESARPATNTADLNASDAAQAAYDANPMLIPLRRIESEIADEGLTGEAAKQRRESRIDQMRDQFMQGVNSGYIDPAKQEETQQNVMGSLMAGDFRGAIKALVMSIPFVGEFLGAAGKWIMSKFGGESISFGEAREQIKLEGSMQAGLLNIGVQASPEYTKAFVKETYGDVSNPNFQPATRADPVQIVEPTAPADAVPAEMAAAEPARSVGATPPSVQSKANIPLDVSLMTQSSNSLDANTLAKIEALRKKGELVDNNGKPFASAEALAVLDNIPSQQLPGRIGGSWKDEAPVTGKTKRR